MKVKITSMLLLAVMTLVSAIGCQSLIEKTSTSQRANEFSEPVSISISAEKSEVQKGDTTQIKVFIQPLIDRLTWTTTISLPIGMDLVQGELSWQEQITSGQNSQHAIVVKVDDLESDSEILVTTAGSEGQKIAVTSWTSLQIHRKGTTNTFILESKSPITNSIEATTNPNLPSEETTPGSFVPYTPVP